MLRIDDTSRSTATAITITAGDILFGAWLSEPLECPAVQVYTSMVATLQEPPEAAVFPSEEGSECYFTIGSM